MIPQFTKTDFSSDQARLSHAQDPIVEIRKQKHWRKRVLFYWKPGQLDGNHSVTRTVKLLRCEVISVLVVAVQTPATTNALRPLRIGA